MPWLQPGSTSPPGVSETQANRKISKWPMRGTKRVEAKYRMLWGEGRPYPRASHYMFQFNTTGALADWRNGFLSVDVVNEDLQQGITEENASGQTLELNVEQFRAPNKVPFWDAEGIQWRWTYRRVGFADPFNIYWFWFAEHEQTPPASPIPVDIWTDINSPTPGIFVLRFDPTGPLDTDWSPFQTDAEAFKFWAYSECWTVPTA